MYNKIFTKILDSSIWLEDNATRIVWITLIAAMDEDGYAHFSSVKNLAIRAQVSPEEAEKAVKVLSGPDPDSASPEHEGRRIERVPGGFFILNAERHRELVTRAVQREKTRERVAKHRAKKKAEEDVTLCNDSVTQSYTDTEAVSDKKKRETVKSCIQKNTRFKPPTIEQVRSYCQERKNNIDPEAFINFYQSKNWMIGKNKMKDWQAAVRTWEKRETGSQKKPTKLQRAAQNMGMTGGSNVKTLDHD